MKEDREELLKQWRALSQLPEPSSDEEKAARQAQAAALLERIEEAEKETDRVEPLDALEVYEAQVRQRRLARIKEEVRRGGRDLRFWWNN